MSVFFITCAIVVLTANISVGFGTFLAIITPNIDSTVGLIGPTALPILIYSGFLINNKFVLKLNKTKFKKRKLFKAQYRTILFGLNIFRGFITLMMQS